eukprot:TRINITY_DN7294_c0_g1_i5.p1 TRINITY_DN7294_c0_g1~~TRINITY_DN7294_c0_g1_i5.p1  ORF type:complete len:357 (+),score=59.83 TRINITY_DN7294_c0_g1_i5:62-1132(+)
MSRMPHTTPRDYGDPPGMPRTTPESSILQRMELRAIHAERHSIETEGDIRIDLSAALPRYKLSRSHTATLPSAELPTDPYSPRFPVKTRSPRTRIESAPKPKKTVYVPFQVMGAKAPAWTRSQIEAAGVHLRDQLPPMEETQQSAPSKRIYASIKPPTAPLHVREIEVALPMPVNRQAMSPIKYHSSADYDTIASESVAPSSSGHSLHDNRTLNRRGPSDARQNKRNHAAKGAAAPPNSTREAMSHRRHDGLMSVLTLDMPESKHHDRPSPWTHPNRFDSIFNEIITKELTDDDLRNGQQPIGDFMPGTALRGARPSSRNSVKVQPTTLIPDDPTPYVPYLPNPGLCCRWFCHHGK